MTHRKPRPYFTIASNDAALWYRHVSIPSLGMSGYVEDTGAPLDIMMPSCAATYAVTGWRKVLVW